MCETQCCALLQEQPPHEQFVTVPSLPIKPQAPTEFELLDVQNEDEMAELLLTCEMQLPQPAGTWIFTLRSSSGDHGALSRREEQCSPREGAHCWEEALWDWDVAAQPGPSGLVVYELRPAKWTSTDSF